MKFRITFFLIVISQLVHAQNTSSPYSILGLGDLNDNFYNRTSGMANTGIGYRSNSSLVGNNPAAYSALQPQFFVVELGGRGQVISYSGKPVGISNPSSNDISFSKLSLGTKVTKWWGSSIGLMPFSKSNYSFNGVKYLTGSTTTISAYYDGTGGVNQVYWGNGFLIGKHLSVGFNASFLFGSLSQTETIVDATATGTAVTTTNNNYFNNLYLNYGIQYAFALNKKLDVSLGATYAQKQTLRVQDSLEVTDGSTVIVDKLLTDREYSLPQMYGFGAAFTLKKTLTFVADYKHQDWATLDQVGQGYKLKNSNRYSVGVEKSVQAEAFNLKIEKYYYQAGLYYNDSYLSVSGQPIREMGITGGFGFNFKRAPMALQMTLEYGSRGTTKSGLIKENIISTNLTFIYHDFWYTKGRRYN